ncbi:hypothetical protein B0T25DRAFT_617967 [Lasiosphaeria hispida]|uniref:G domain-containing protein n=1 Tax=Lasiosphaeria hispida TaxID=260671 RepID=A0AAJ0H7P3_9PEZI|nr:hypothetical protein B0T25DRAFT_617967 [Lasiosphaeria hispida]
MQTYLGTTDVEQISFMYNRNLRVHLIDTPGFDDTNRSDVEVLQDIAHWLSASFQDGIRLSGIVYMHRISDLRMAGSARRNLVMFKKLCGEKAYQSVVLATSMWSKVSDNEGRERERQLVETDAFWGLMCKRGSRVLRYLNTRESALDLVGYILSLHTKVTLEIQDEIVNKGHEIDETSAAHELNAEILRERAKHVAELAAAREDMKQAMFDRDHELQQIYRDEIDDLQDKILKATTEQQKLTQTLEEVNRRKEEEFSAFRNQISREQEQERERYARERQEYLEEMERKQDGFQRTLDEQRRQHEVRICEMNEEHRRAMADLADRMGRRPPTQIHVNLKAMTGVQMVHQVDVSYSAAMPSI